MRNIAIPTLFVLSTIFIGLSFFGSWSLVQTMNDMADYNNKVSMMVIFHSAETLPVPPADRFLGTGMLGWMFPTGIAILGTLGLTYARRWMLSSVNVAKRVRAPRKPATA